MVNIFKSNEEVCDFLDNFFWQRTESDKEELFQKLLVALQWAIENQLQDAQCEAHRLVAEYYDHKNDIRQTKIEIEKGLAIAYKTQNKRQLLQLLNLMLKCDHILGETVQAQLHINELKTLIEGETDLKLIGATYNTLGIHYGIQKNKAECVRIFKKGIELSEHTNKRLCAYYYSGLGGQLTDFEDYEEAIIALNKCIEYAQVDNVSYIINTSLCNLGICYYKLKMFDKAEESIVSAANFFSEKGLDYELMYTQIQTAALREGQGRYQEALNILLPYEPIIKEKNEMILLNDYTTTLHKVYAGLGNFEKAYQALLEKKKVSDQLFNENSDKRVKQLEVEYSVRELNQEKEKALQLAKVKHDFLANMSHEIRTPINHVLGLSNLLESENDIQKHKTYNAIIQKSANHLLHLINDLLDISKIEASKYELILQPTNLAHLVASIVEQHTHSFKENGNQLFLENKTDNLIIQCDALRLQQIIQNLLSNANKFTTNGNVKLRISSNASVVKIEISDTGIGMSDTVLKQLFNEYHQASAEVKIKYGGTGLGLAIVKKLVELMNGNIQVESVENQGTSFVLTLPIKITTLNENIVTQRAFDSTALNNWKIFIADDVPNNCLILKEQIQRLNSSIVVSSFENGKLLFDQFQIEKPNLVFCDLEMPVWNGFKTIAEIRKKYSKEQLTVIASTSSLLLDAYQELLELGFNEVLQNPITTENLKEVFAFDFY